MKTRTAAALLACTLAACSDDAGNPVAPSAPGGVPEPAAAAAAEPAPSGLPAAAVHSMHRSKFTFKSHKAVLW